MAMGVRFAKWGLGLFIFGVFLTFGMIVQDLTTWSDR